MSAIGQYRHKVRPETPGAPVPDGDGGFTENWQPLDPPEWDCSIEAATVRDLERMVAGAVQATATHLVRGRYHPGINVDTRLVFGSRRLLVQYVNDVDERQIALVLVCAEELTRHENGTRNTRARRATAGVAATPDGSLD